MTTFNQEGKKDVYTENYKTLLKKVKAHLDQWKDTHVHEQGDQLSIAICIKILILRAETE